ncbi:hypothetical protein DL240_16995 [Lujinxingia litoralis]|uniref:Uncharacterized protein n=2 Tax=Lujinxingia litoralis TaxID=2211119 RepID=A0A328C1M4_9DELT|nr:hypothetical protein DL240_16995 [Lujinxingia litoralis]
MFLAGCEASERPAGGPDSPESQGLMMPEGEGEGGGFAFDESLLLEGAESLSEQVPPASCVGATEEEARVEGHPSILRGVVLAPQGQLARRSNLLEYLIPTAHAAPLEGELPVDGAEVALYRVDGRGEPAGEALVRTTTDRAGQWCVRMPDDAEFGPQLMLIATAGERRLRRPVLHRADLDLYSQPEALLRLIVEEGLSLNQLTIATYLNLDVMAQSAVDLIAPVSVEGAHGVESLLARLQQTMAEDPRLSQALERLYEE